MSEKTTTNYYITEKSDSKITSVAKGSGKFLVIVLQVFVVIVTIGIVLYLFVLTPHVVNGISMQPNFCHKDVYLAEKITKYNYDDVIVFKYDEANDFIKRIVGKPGDTIKILDGKVYRNNQVLNPKYLNPSVTTTAQTGLSEGEEYIVPGGKFFVMGDNRPNSTDSRTFLAIDPSQIKGKALVTIWPLKRVGLFDKDLSRPLIECD